MKKKNIDPNKPIPFRVHASAWPIPYVPTTPPKEQVKR